MKISCSVTGNNVVDFDKQHYKADENFLTLGTSSYINGLELWIGSEKNILGNTLIGRYSSLSWNLTFLIARNHNYKAISTHPKFQMDATKKSSNPRQIIIGHDVLIGHGVMILGGVKIGNGAFIGAGAVVAKNIPPYAIAVGNPARVIKYRFDEATIKKLLAVKWWNWSLEKIADNRSLMNDIEKFLEAHYSPELENFPEDECTQMLNNFLGQKIYQFIADFEAKNPLWLKIVKNFRKANLEDALLVIWLSTDASAEDVATLTQAVDFDKNILIFKHEKNFSPAALRKSTHFITTREMTTLEALDYLWNKDVKIVSALDDNIFGG